MINDILQQLTQADEQLLLFLNGMHTTFGDYFWFAFTGKFIWVPMYAALLYVVLRSSQRKTALFVVLAIALTITLADQTCATVIRPVVARLRPSNLENPLSEFIHIVNGKRGGMYGFPSCHATNSFGLAFMVMYLFRNRWLTTFILIWAALNSYSRLYLGVHYPGDILVGTIVGFCAASVVYFLFCLVAKQKKVELKQPQYFIYTGVLTVIGIAGYALFMTL